MFSGSYPSSYTLAGVELHSRFFQGTALYPSAQVLQAAIGASHTQVLTVSLKRQLAIDPSLGAFFDTLPPGILAVPPASKTSGEIAAGKEDEKLSQVEGKAASHTASAAPGNRPNSPHSPSLYLLPNTAGCYTAQEAINVAQMARELFKTHWIKLEVIGDKETLQSDPFELLEATRVLVKEGFEVFPYCTEDLVACQRLVDIGCRILMPWGSPIGSGQGLRNPYALQTLRERLPEVFLVVDAGIRSPADALLAMQMGYDAVLVNSAVAKAQDPVRMAQAFRLAVEAGRLAYEAGIMPPKTHAVASTPVGAHPFGDGSSLASTS